MRRPALAKLIVLSMLGVATFAAAAVAEPGQGLAVDVRNGSEPVLCAEKDNVTLDFASPDVRSFRIEAAHPSYVGMLARDSFEADWTACDMTSDASHAGGVQTPTRQTLYEEPAFWVVGWKLPTYWRPATATFRIGERVETGLHLVQVWMIRPMGGEEVLVLYPQDGYWRIRPLAPEGRAPTAFGTSFLVGPVETEVRPIVKLKDVAFDPKAKRFSLSFERGGGAQVTMSEVTTNKHMLDVVFDETIAGRPFAALRSMYVTDFNNDMARVAVRSPDSKGWAEAPIMSFKGGSVTDLWAGRANISRHNSSSPDMVLSHFSRAGTK
ncbi:MAG: hypothetical protein AB7E81_11860 [Hyphomicrobiaceae bacterium]